MVRHTHHPELVEGQITMEKITNSKYNLEQRTQDFARRCRNLTKQVSRTISNIEDSKQLIRSSGSVAANYIEANEALSKKDLLMRVKICKKEAKESRLWLRLLEYGSNLENERQHLLKESDELMKIFGAIIEKLK